jgi:stage V sporulation protein R
MSTFLRDMSRFNDRVAEVKEVGRRLGLDFFETYFEVVPFEIMTEIAAYGLPTRAQHWSYGKVYNHQKIHGEMGLSKIYEIVLNNDPCYAFLLDTNTEVANLMVAAHVFGHCDFFRNNVYFADSNRNMVNDAVSHAIRIDGYREKYGEDRVERVMDIAFSIDRHIDFHKGLTRKRYPQREVIERIHKPHEYADLFPGEEKLSVTHRVIGEKLPPHPEKDLLWFLANYGRLEPWERDILEVMRAESFYFFPQFETKVINEGWASYWHAEIMKTWNGLTPDETVDFAKLHSDVVQPGGRLRVNPYYLGYRILCDIKKRWDQMYQRGEAKVDGTEKLFEVRRTENDVSFVSNYLTPELASEMNLFVYGRACDCGKSSCQKCQDIELKSRSFDDVIKALTWPKFNYGVPKIVITEVKNNMLLLQQEATENGGLDLRYAEKTLEYVHQLWKGPVKLRTVDDDLKPIVLTYSENGFKIMEGRGDKQLLSI